jgi:hypothetical protein
MPRWTCLSLAAFTCAWGCAESSQTPVDAGTCQSADCAALAPPSSVTVSAGHQFALVRWTAPAGNLTGFTVVLAPAGGSPLVLQTAQTSLLVSQLVDDTAYAVTVAAVVAGGTGPFSQPVAVTPRGSCTRSFALHRSYPTAGAPTQVVLADFDNDGFPDLAVAQSGGVGVMLNDRTGTLLARTDLPLGGTPSALVAADLTGDGLPDLAAGGPSTSVLPSVLIAQRDAGFAAPVGFPGGVGMLAAIDVDSDSIADLASGGAQLQLFSDFVDGGSRQQTIPTTIPPTLLAAGDFAGTGLPGLAVASPQAQTFEVLANTDGGTLGAPSTYALSANPAWIATADFNGDGLADLAFAAQAQVLIHLRQPFADAGVFADESAVPAGASPSFLATADLDLDGFADLVFTSATQNLVGALLNQRDGGFGPPLLFPTGNGPASVAVGDLNGDGFPDLAVANQADGTVSIYLNVCGP